MYQTSLTYFLLLISWGLFAQNSASISGKIIDESNTEPLSFATVVLNASDGHSMVAGALSDETGNFVFEGIPEGKYHVVCSFLGYLTDSVSLLVGAKNSIYDLGKIALQPASTDLDEVLVEAKKATVSAGLDKKSFSLDDQVAQSGGSVLDAMKALPGVTVDQEGNVLLRGSNQVAVLVDGKQSGMTGFGNQQGLANIPAANIESIEIINNPSAKYDATGMAGIINIIYKKEKQNGFSGSAGLTL